MSPTPATGEPNSAAAWLAPSTCQAGAVDNPVAEPRKTYALPMFTAEPAKRASPTTRSEKPSRLTSPAPETESPKWAFAWLAPTTCQVGAVDSPVAEPRNTYALPISTAAPSKRYSPTTTSEKPSPLTSPAPDTDAPKYPVAWLAPIACQLGAVMSGSTVSGQWPSSSTVTRIRPESSESGSHLRFARSVLPSASITLSPR